MFATPTAIRSMMAIDDAGARYPQRFRVVCSAGEPLNPEAIRWFRDQYGVTVLDYYGLTESYPLCGNFPFMEVREGSMGRPMPGWEVAILDEDEQPVPAGERGEICLRARSNPHYPLGYWRLPEASAETFGGEWFHTKDAARMDEDGYVWYEGRADDVIIAAGYRIGPFEVESACLEHPAVAEAAAVAAPDERRGTSSRRSSSLAAGHEPSERARRGHQGASSASGCPPTPTRAGSSSSPELPEDADRQDPSDRAARAGARARVVWRGGGARTPTPDRVSRRRPRAGQAVLGELLGVELGVRGADEGEGWETSSADLRLGVHERGRGPGDSASLPYFAVADIARALEQVRALGGSVVHPGDRWAICRDSEGSPFGLSQSEPAQ